MTLTDPDAALLSLLEHVARAMESVVPDLSLSPELGSLVWLGDVEPDDTQPRPSVPGGDWVRSMGFTISYLGAGVRGGPFLHASSGSDGEQVMSVARELMSLVQDEIAEATTEPWPLVIVNGRRDMALADAAIEGDELHLWYGDRSAPALRLPPVKLTEAD